MKSNKAANKLQIDTVIKNLEKRNIKGYYCEDVEAGCQLVLSMIEDKSVISWGGSVTLNAIKVKEKLAERDVEIIDPYSSADRDESLERRRKGLLADYFLMSTNAITMDGELVNVDGTSNRVAGLCFGPKKVIVVAGANKMVQGLDDALARIKVNASVPNSVRLKRNTPCTITGVCSDCLAKDCICCNIVTTRYSGTPDRIHVILINEDLGY
ncbi:MAG: lactate utilization protein [Eubacteriales bacterium]|nr:lactate utilization protein [Eubacteriales bacterium]MDD3199938.1 lactate utilization protein [Eubacteriales bacterium]MDD4630239.1 lactate utilization protein [Eubacteriales bacterium]